MSIKKYFYNNYSEVQDLINSRGYRNRREMKDEFPGLYDKCYHAGWMKNLIFPDDSTNKRWKDINSLEDAQKFIDQDPSITSTETLRNKYPGLYTRLRSHKYLNNINFKVKSKKSISWDRIDSLEKMTEFIEKNNILQRTELLKRFPGLYRKASVRGWLKEASFCKERVHWQDMSIEDIQKYIDSREELINMESLCTNGLLGLRGYLIKNKLIDKVSFKSTKKSSWEYRLATSLKEAGIDVEIDKNSSYSIWSRLDLVVVGHKIAIEIQGPYHWKEFNQHNYLKVRKSDIKKHRWGIENGTKIFYFTYLNKYLQYGYPYYIYTSEKELISDILTEIHHQINEEAKNGRK